jgi:predicted HD phosphohydrolase
VAVRRWDDAAKVAGAKTPDMQDIRKRVVDYLKRSADAP